MGLIVSPSPQQQRLDAREHIIKASHLIPLGWLSQRTLPHTQTTKKGPVPIYTHPTHHRATRVQPGNLLSQPSGAG